MTKLLFLDCDSTLSAIEGIDELARLKGPETYAEVEALTNAAMNGEIPLGEVFGRRLDLIRPTQSECSEMGKAYIEQLDPTAAETLSKLSADGWTPIILSGGLVPCIQPLADLLKLDLLEAVPVEFDAQGEYVTFNPSAPSSRNGGKPEIIRSYLDRYPNAKTCMVGDGISDLEAAPVVDLFVACATYINRPAVTEKCEVTINNLGELPEILKQRAL